MSLITRTSKGSKLTIEEMDSNLTYLDEKTSSSTISPSASIPTFDFGTILTNVLDLVDNVSPDYNVFTQSYIITDVFTASNMSGYYRNDTYSIGELDINTLSLNGFTKNANGSWSPMMIKYESVTGSDAVFTYGLQSESSSITYNYYDNDSGYTIEFFFRDIAVIISAIIETPDGTTGTHSIDIFNMSSIG